MTDLRLALRQLRQRPAHSIAVILLVAIGVGGNAATFQILDGLFLQPLPFPEADRLVDIDMTAPEWGLEYVHVAYPDFASWRTTSTTLEHIALIDDAGVNLTSSEGTQRADALLTSHEIDDVLGLKPLLGRFYRAEECINGGPALAMISRAFWERQYGGDREVLGKALTVNGQDFEIIGVLPPEAQLVRRADIWFPIRLDDTDGEGRFTFRSIGLLAEGSTLEEAREELFTLHQARIEETGFNEATSPVVQPFRERYLGGYRFNTLFSFAAVGGVLLLACINIAGLVLARSLSRTEELRIRLALGASRGRVIRQLFTENLLLAILGTALGTHFGLWVSGFLLKGFADQLPPWVSFEPNLHLLLFLVITTALVTCLFGLGPALYATRRAAPAPGQRVSTGRGQLRVLGGLLATQAALAVALLLVGSSVGLDALAVGEKDPGFHAESVARLRVSTAGSSFAEREDWDRLLATLPEELGALPGVIAVTAANQLPLTDHWGAFPAVEGQDTDAQSATPVVQQMIVSPSYFETMGIPLLQGRIFNHHDGKTEGTAVTVVSESFAKFYLGDGEPILNRRIDDGGGWMTIIGVVPDIHHDGPAMASVPAVYKPLAQRPLPTFELAVRGEGPASAVLAETRQFLRRNYPELTLFSEGSLTALIDDALWSHRAIALVLGSFALVALMLTVVGLYGTTCFLIHRRIYEIGIRLALGALPRRIRTAILARIALVVGIGSILGLATAALGNQLVAAILLATETVNLWLYSTVAGAVLTISLVAGILAARRATRVQPVTALRAE